MENNRAYLLRKEITKSHLNNRICQHCGVKTSTVTPNTVTFLWSPCLVTSTYQVSSEINGGFFYLGITLKNAEIIEKKWCARVHNFNFKWQFNNTSRNNWKPLLELNFRKNSTKTIRLFALHFYEVIGNEVEGRINYHLIEIKSELSHC